MCDYDENIQYDVGTVWTFDDTRWGGVKYLWMKVHNGKIKYFSTEFPNGKDSYKTAQVLTEQYCPEWSYCDNITPYVPPREPAPVGTIWNTKSREYPNRYYIMLPDGLYFNWGGSMGLIKSSDDPVFIDENRERINNNERV